MGKQISHMKLSLNQPKDSCDIDSVKQEINKNIWQIGVYQKLVEEVIPSEVEISTPQL